MQTWLRLRGCWCVEYSFECVVWTCPHPAAPNCLLLLTHLLPRRDMGAPLPECDTVYFPYAVVEIKLQSAPPAWVQGLLQTGGWASGGLSVDRVGVGRLVGPRVV